MEDLSLSETEMRYFGDLFLCCDEESNGKIPILKATELFRSSNVSNEILKQIMDISVSPHICTSLNHLNRKQFYSCLKLIAAHQQNMAINPDLLPTTIDLQLPRFTWTLNSGASADLIELSNSPKEYHMPKRERSFPSAVGAYEPIRLSSNLSDSDVPQAASHDNADAVSTDSEIESETTSQRSESRRRGKNGSPWSTASDSPTPTNSIAERPHPVWEHSATGRGVWPVNTGEEHTQLLGTEEESSDRHSSDEEASASEDMWRMSGAQARHYAVQFMQLRPEGGLLPGHTAKLFFEKSRLSLTDLRKIWQLADITNDGALSLEEFSIAMHLIVLRRNNAPIPEVLPASLAAVVVGGSRARGSAEGDVASAAVDSLDTPSAGKEWTKFVDSPTSSLSSPGPKPVNFDFHKAALERDPKIFHPVALRVTPESGGGEGDVRGSPRRDDFAFDPPVNRRATLPPEPPTTHNGLADIRPVQRPQPKKPPKTVGALPPPPAREPSHGDEGPHSLQFIPKKEPPPPPPPRPLRNHARSSSLDLTRLKGAPPPPPPPRASPPASPPPYALEGLGAASNRMQGAFEVVGRREGSSGEETRALREQNAVLHRVCRALLLELADVQRDREALRLQLEQPIAPPPSASVPPPAP